MGRRVDDRCWWTGKLAFRTKGKALKGAAFTSREVHKRLYVYK